MIECKAWGGPDEYPFLNDLDFKGFFEEMIEKWEYFKESPTNKWDLSDLDELWLVIPGFCDYKSQIEADLSEELNYDIKIIPIHELIIKIIFEIKQDKDVRRKRYSNPALELCRWLLRSYETGQLNLSDIDLMLKEETQTYETLKRTYFRECMRAVQKNVEKRKAGINTRINTLKILMELEKATIPQLVKEAEELGYDLDYSRINAGLTTWIDLGIVSGNIKDGFSITESFAEIVDKELE